MPDHPIPSSRNREGSRSHRTLSLLLILIVATVLLTPFSSERPDGLESVIERLSLHGEPEATGASSLPDLNRFPWTGRFLGVLLAGAAGWAFYSLGAPRRGGSR